MFKSQFYRTEGTGFPAGPETIGGGGGGGGGGGLRKGRLRPPKFDGET